MTSLALAAVLLSACISVNTEKFYQKHDLHIAVLGSDRNCLLAVSYGKEAVLFDMSGEFYAPDYAESYLEQKGIQEVEDLYLCSPKEKTIKRYAEYLSFFMPDRLWMMKETDISVSYLKDMEICFAEQKELLFHGAKITVSQKQISIEYADKLYICTNEKAEISGTPDILTIYGRSKSVYPECGLLLILDQHEAYLPDSHTYIHENNLEITISENGTCRVRRLYGGT